VIKQNLVQVQHASKLPVTFEQAIKGAKVKDDLNGLKESLRLIMVKIGLRAQNWPDDLEKAVLLEHIATNYGNHTTDEIRLAFDMAIADRLDIDTVNCYENFSCVYFSGIMNAYRKWASVQHKEIKPVLTLPPMMEEITDEETLRMAEGFCKLPEGWKLLSLSAYKILGKQGHMNYTDAERQEIRKAANAYIDEMFLKDPHLFTGTTRESMTDNFCKKLAVAKYFKAK